MYIYKLESKYWFLKTKYCSLFYTELESSKLYLNINNGWKNILNWFSWQYNPYSFCVYFHERLMIRYQLFYLQKTPSWKCFSKCLLETTYFHTVINMYLLRNDHRNKITVWYLANLYKYRFSLHRTYLVNWTWCNG